MASVLSVRKTILVRPVTVIVILPARVQGVNGVAGCLGSVLFPGRISRDLIIHAGLAGWPPLHGFACDLGLIGTGLTTYTSHTDILMFDLLRRQNKADDAPVAAPEGLLKDALAGLKRLPMLPEAAHRALALTNDPDCTLSDLTAVIETDLTMSTRVLKLANSPLYRTGRAVETLGQAVIRLGMRECQNLILTASMESLFHNRSGIPKKAACEALWRHSLLTACTCRHLNRALRLGFMGEEFAGGLAHDIGRILIALVAPNSFDAADPMDFQEDAGTLDRERAVLGLDHCYLGAYFGDRNQLPSRLVATVLFHHAPQDAGEHRDLAALIATADHMANYLQRTGSAEGYGLRENLGWSCLSESRGDTTEGGLESSAVLLMTEAVEEAQAVLSGGSPKGKK